MAQLRPGCRAIIINDQISENNGKEVIAIDCIGPVKADQEILFELNVWEPTRDGIYWIIEGVNGPIAVHCTEDGRIGYVSRMPFDGKQLMPIDDFDEEESDQLITGCGTAKSPSGIITLVE